MLLSVTARTWFLPSSAQADRPCLGFVRGDRSCLQIDAGNSPAHFALMQRELCENSLPAPSLIALTHSHWDHTFGLGNTAIPAVCCLETQEALNKMSRWAWTPEAMQTRLFTREDIPFCHEHILEEYADTASIRVRTADVVFSDRLTLDLGGVHAELLHLPSSHADDCTVVFVPEEGVVFLGDIGYEDLHHEPPCWHRACFQALRDALTALPFEWAVPGHQGLHTRRELLDDLSARLDDGLPVLP